MTLDQLWAGWREEYVQAATAGTRPEGCVFCRIADSGPPSPENGMVWRGATAMVVLNLYPYTSGHLLVLPVRHVDDLAGLSGEESDELWSATTAALGALDAAYHPDGLNMGANLGHAAGAGIPRHVHLHALPRWVADTNFMTTVAGTRVMPESLTSTWEKLRAAWPAG